MAKRCKERYTNGTFCIDFFRLLKTLVEMGCFMTRAFCSICYACCIYRNFMLIFVKIVNFVKNLEFLLHKNID